MSLSDKIETIKHVLAVFTKVVDVIVKCVEYIISAVEK